MASKECEQEMNIWEINLEVACWDLHAWQTQHDPKFWHRQNSNFCLYLGKNKIRLKYSNDGHIFLQFSMLSYFSLFLSKEEPPESKPQAVIFVSKAAVKSHPIIAARELRVNKSQVRDLIVPMNHPFLSTPLPLKFLHRAREIWLHNCEMNISYQVCFAAKKTFLFVAWKIFLAINCQEKNGAFSFRWNVVLMIFKYQPMI